MHFKRLILAAAMAASAAGSAHAATDIQWWHSMSGVTNDWVNSLAKQFNESQSDYRIVPTYKGAYDESMTAAMAAFRAGNAPDILQVFEVGTATMMSAKGATVPVAKLMQDAGVAFDPKSYIPAVASYYTAPNGQMLSFPFNSSTTVMFYNKDAFKKAGLNPDQPPKTWPELFAATKKLKESGNTCPMTLAWQGWVQLESFAAWHNVEFATHQNGLGVDGYKARLKINTPLFEKHIGNLAQAAKNGELLYRGRGSTAFPSFISGECAIVQTSSSSYGEAAQNAKFNFGIAPLPYYPDVKGAPQNTVIGGASLWAIAGKNPDHYKGVAKFFEFLSKPSVQAASHQLTGYLPITKAAFEVTDRSGFYAKLPGADVAVNQMVRKVTDNSRGIRLGNYVQIRTIEDEEMEQVWAGKKSAKEALDTIVQRGNELLTRFERSDKK